MAERLHRLPPEPACFVLVFAAYVTYFLAAGYDRFYWDAAEYWRLGGQFEDDGDFSLLAYDDPYRGYSLPLLNDGLRSAASALGLGDVTIVELTGGLLAATFGVVVLPRLARALFPAARIDWPRVLALNALLFIFWRDHFNFPLTDFPALLCASVGILGLLRMTAAGYVVAGVAFGLAMNLRPAYLPALGLALAVAALRPLLRDWTRRALAVALVLAGAIAVSVPQVAINHHYAGGWSPTLRASRDVAMVQLSGGLIAQRYETYVGPADEYPRPKVFYIDPFGSEVLEDEGIGGVTSYGQYARVVLHHPVSMAASYPIHLFNGLDVWYPTPYVRDLEDRRVLLSLLQYTLLFVAIARFALPEARRRLGRISWAGLAVLLSPCLTAIPGAVEPRFFLPIYAVVYMLVCFGPEYRASFLATSTRRRVAIAASYAAFAAACLTLSAGTRAQIEYPNAISSTLPRLSSMR